MDSELDDRNGDEDEIEDVNTQIYRLEDEIEDVTQVNRAGRDKVSSISLQDRARRWVSLSIFPLQGRPTAKTTYSRKRKDVKR
jgi:hypothetical protein